MPFTEKAAVINGFVTTKELTLIETILRERAETEMHLSKVDGTMRSKQRSRKAELEKKKSKMEQNSRIFLPFLSWNESPWFFLIIYASKAAAISELHGNEGKQLWNFLVKGHGNQCRFAILLRARLDLISYLSNKIDIIQDIIQVYRKCIIRKKLDFFRLTVGFQ